MNTVEGYFSDLYVSDDPYGYRDRWYEQRKRALILATLPHVRYRVGWEWGCSNGELTAELARRCDDLQATDLSSRAVELAKQRVASLPNVKVACARHPQQWPTRTFDLIVFSEVGYFLTADELRQSVPLLRQSLGEQGVLIACHWRHPFAEGPCSGELVHEVLRADIHLPRLFAYDDDDFQLEAWSARADSVAVREGIR